MERNLLHLMHVTNSWTRHANLEKMMRWTVTMAKSQRTGAIATHSSLKRRRRKNQRLHLRLRRRRLHHHHPLLPHHPHHRQLNLLQVTTVQATGVMVRVLETQPVMAPVTAPPAQELMPEMMLVVLALHRAVLVVVVPLLATLAVLVVVVVLLATLAMPVAEEVQLLGVVEMPEVLAMLVVPAMLVLEMLVQAVQVQAEQFLPLPPHQPLAVEALEVQEVRPVLHLPQCRKISLGQSTWTQMRRCLSKASRASSLNTTTWTPWSEIGRRSSKMESILCARFVLSTQTMIGAK